MSIGEFATATGLSAKALRLYDSMGLVIPAAVDQFSGYRWYDPEQVDGARLVARLRLLGMPLEEIREVLLLPEASRLIRLRAWWRRTEAEHDFRRQQLALLVDEMTGQEDTMNVEQQMVAATASRCGRGRRDLALDLTYVGSRLFAVVDGFGSDPELPARMRAAQRAEPVGSVDPLAFLEEFVASLEGAIEAAPAESGAGGALSAVLLGDDRATVAHVGDTRLHLIRDGRVELLTRDHTFVQALVAEGRLTPEEARLEEDRALLSRAMSSTVPSDPDFTVVTTRAGDRFVLTTDGVHAVLPPAQLAELMGATGHVEEVAESMERAVMGAGAPDNYAVVVIDLES